MVYVDRYSKRCELLAGMAYFIRYVNSGPAKWHSKQSTEYTLYEVDCVLDLTIYNRLIESTVVIPNPTGVL